MPPREQIASTINGSLQRLPLVLEILDEIHETKGPGAPGDEELRYGSIRAVQTMVERLGQIVPAPVIASGPVSLAEQMANEWLLGEQPQRLLPEPLLGKLSESIARLLPFHPDLVGRTEDVS